ncbi:hypothetical protein DL93DRAFT_138139 [Clavulina sp. PMI_390]|nr:hypothetical protein DL93DRAFT_138139 [Clavulina sp. PMI_390]
MSSPHGHGHPLPHAYSRPTATGSTFAIVDANNTPINVVHEPVDSSPGPESDALLSYPSAFASGDNDNNNDCNDDHNLGMHDDELQAHYHELEDADSSVHTYATSASSAIGAIGGHDDPPLTAPLTGVNIPPMSDSGPVPILALHPRLPRLDRSASMPAEAHLGHLRPPPLHPRHSHPRLHNHSTSHSHSHHHHPHRHTYSHTYFAEPTPLTSASSSAPVPGPEHAHAPYDEVSRELADTVQAIVQTLLHLSPPHILHPVKELFSACTVQLPTPSVSALLTTMKNLNYLSANLRGLAPAPGEAGSSPSSSPIATTTIGVPTASATSASIANQGENVFAEAQPVSPTAATGGVSDNFDVGEVVQSVGDVLGGLAAQAGVDLAIFHGDVGMRHINVIGDEQSILFILTHITRQILSCARPGDSIEIGLHLTSLLHHNSTLADPSSSPSVSSSPLTQPSSVDPLVTAPGEFISPILIEVGTPILTTFEITHRWKGSGTATSHVPPPEPRSSLDTEGVDTGLEPVASTTGSAETGTAADSTQMHGQQQQQHRESPRLDSILIKRLLSKTGTTLDIRPSGNASSSSPRTSPAVPKAGSAAARIPSTMTMGDTTYLLSTRLVRGPAPARLAAPPSLTLLDDDESLVLSHSAAHSHSHSHTQSLPASVSPSPLPGQTAPHPPLLPFSLPMHAPLPKGALELAQEPNMEDLAIFSEVELRGKRAVLHAAEDSTFARHLTSYLTSWGLDVGHVPINAGPHLTRRGGAGGTETDGGTTGAGSALGTDDASSGAAALGSGDPSNTGLGPEEMSLLSVQIQIDPTTGAMLSPPTSETHSGMDGGGSTGHTPNTSDGSIAGGVGSGGGGPSMTSTSASSSVGHPAFIIIDDDVDVLRRILNRYRPEVPHVTPSPLKRPSLALNHRPRSSPQIRSVLGISTPNEKRSRAPTHQPGTTSTSPSGGTTGAGAEPLTPNPNVSATPGASAINGATDAGTNGPQAQLSSQSPHIHVYTPPHQDSIIVHITSLAHYKAVKDTIQASPILDGAVYGGEKAACGSILCTYCDQSAEPWRGGTHGKLLVHAYAAASAISPWRRKCHRRDRRRGERYDGEKGKYG